MDKKRVLIVGISMPCAGTEKALLSFLKTVDFGQYDISLLLAKKEGELINKLPENVTVLGPLRFGDLFLLSRKNAVSTLSSLFLAHPSAILLALPYFFHSIIKRKDRQGTMTQMWVRLMQKYCPSFEEEFPTVAPFDLVLSFWGDRTMFYACDKIKAPRHLTWLHFEYPHPSRKDSLYRTYFARCDRVISVTEDCTAILRARFPELSQRFLTFENRISPTRIRALAARPLPFALASSDRPMILTVARICEQKGVDRIPTVLHILKSKGYAVNWCIVGEGEEEKRRALIERARDLCVDDSLFLIGTMENPYPMLSLCDIFVLPSRFEGKPISVEEAKILGCPIVVCDYLSARKQLDQGKLGIICPQDDGEGVALAIITLLESPQLRENYKTACLSSIPDLPGQGMDDTRRLLSGEI